MEDQMTLESARIAQAAQQLRGDAVELSGVCRTYGNVMAVEDVDLKVSAGEFVAIVGPSGCGKSTLLRLVGGLDVPSRGTVSIGGRDVTREPANRRPTSTVFQRGAVFPHLSVFNNVAYPLEIRRMGRAAIHARTMELLELVRLTKLADRAPSALSGGQLQRVAVARALAASPAVLLMDEPLSALDAELKRELEFELRRIHHMVGVTVLYVTHDQQEAMTLADRIAVMDGGCVQQYGTPTELLLEPASEFVATFFGHSTVVLATIVQSDSSGTDFSWEGHVFTIPSVINRSPGDTVALALRPSCVRVVAADVPNSAMARVCDIIRTVDRTRLQVEIVGGGVKWLDVNVDVTPLSGEPGQTVGLQVDPKMVVVIR
jgi:ABC-type Fe3+/spermidine/putrescine transport system ATPase subunit